MVRALRSQPVWQGELTARRADGRTVPVRLTAQRLANGSGRPAALLGNFVDISAEHKARESWRAEREFTELVMSGAGVLVAALDEEGRFVRFNAECERISGWPADEVLGRFPWDTVLPPEIADQVRAEAFAVAMASAGTGRTTTYTNEWLARDGSRRLIEWTNRVVLNHGGMRRFMIAVGVDITARHAAEQALLRSEAQLRQAQAVARLGSWELDVASGRVEWSDEVYELFELDRTRFTPSYEAFLSVIYPDDRDAVAAAYEGSLKSRTPYRIEHRLRMADGRIKWVEERCETDFDADGRPLRSRGTVQDVTERHLRDAELQRFRHMVENAPEEVWLVDEQYRVRYVNRAAADSLGYTREQLLGMSLADINARGAEAVRTIWQTLLQAIEEGRTPPPVELEHRAADGRCIAKEMYASLVEIDGQKYRVGFARNIEERRRIQSALVASEAQLREALDTYPGWVSCVDEQMRYLFVNGQFCTMAGLRADEIIGRTADEVLGPAHSAARWTMHRRLMVGEGDLTSERRFVDLHGRERVAWVQYRAVDRAADGRRVYYAFASDITEMRQAQERLSAVTQGMGVGFWECTFPDQDLEFNDELLALLGHTRAEVSGPLTQWLLAPVHPQDRARRKHALKALAERPAPVPPLQFRVRHKDGHFVWVQEQLRVLSRDAQGRAQRMTGVVQDISLLKAREAELQQLNAELEQRIEQRTLALEQAKQEAERASAAKSEFLSQMSHELRTPLNAILGFGQLLELSPLAPEDAEHIQQVMRGGRHLLELIDEILDLATVEAGRVPLRDDPVALPPLIEECTRLLRPLAQAAGVQVEAGPLPEDAVVSADRGRLRQVLLNLMSNAIKYNRPSQGRVDLALQRCAGPGSPWQLSVSDIGPGLDEAQLARLFQPFERLGAERSAVKGTGIGLALSRRLVELMGGSIGVSSRPGHGSTFWIRLPAAGPESALPPAPPASSEDGSIAPGAATGRRRRVLYVEDHDANRLLMQRMLARREHIELRTAASAEEALALAPDFRPQLLLLDIQLAGVDGHELLRLLREQGQQAPAVAISAYAMAADLARGRASGFADYLTKPLDLVRALELVDRLLGDGERDSSPDHPVGAATAAGTQVSSG